MELNYYLDDLRFIMGEDFPENEFREIALDHAREDIFTYARDFDIDEFCKVEEFWYPLEKWKAKT